MTTPTEDEFDAAFKKSNATVSASLHEVALPQGDDTTDGSNEPLVDGEPATLLDAPAAPAAAPAPAPAAAAPAPEAAAPAPAAATPAPAPAPAADDDNDPVKLRARLSTVQGMLRAKSDELAALKTAPAPAPAAPAPAPAAPAEPTAEDRETAEILQELEESAPTVYKAVKALLKTETSKLERTFEERVGKRVEEITGRIAPIEAKHKEQTDDEHFSAIAKSHPDWTEVVQSPELIAWVQTQPSYVQREFVRISQEGTAAEVIEVLNQYRAVHPATPAAPAPAAPAPAPATPSAQDAKREAQKRALGTQPARNAPVAPNAAAAKPNDFDSAFETVARRAAPELT